MMIRTLMPLIAVVCLTTGTGAVSAAVINVPADQPTINAGVTAAVNGDEVVLADGVYTGASNRFVNISGKVITIRSASDDPSACVIDGQNLGRAFSAVNITTGTTVIRGIGIRNGIGSGGRAGGIFSQNSNVVIENCVFESCDVTTGGGAVFGTQGTLVIDGCVFDSNTASLFGGAVEVFNGITLTVRDSVFTGNSASVGGAIEFGGGSTSTVTNCLFDENTATGSRFGFAAYGGGAVYVVNGAIVTVSNSTFVENTTDHATANDGGGGLFVLGSTCNVRNSVFWNNSDLSGLTQDGQLKRNGGALVLNSSLVMGLDGSLGGFGNVDADPLFADVSMDNYRAGAGSAMIDAGSNALVPAGTTVDLDGNPRFVDTVAVVDTGAGAAPVVDMGAYEAAADLGNECPEDLDGDNAVGASDLAILLAAWGSGGPADFDGSGAVGASDLAVLLAAWGGC